LLDGESPAEIPFSAPTRTVFAVNPERMSRFGIVLPEALRTAASVGTEESAATTGSTGNGAAR
ncbi:MAG: hypothetical protein ACKOYN_08460, partial [Planctomycetota bacterium]